MVALLLALAACATTSVAGGTDSATAPDSGVDGDTADTGDSSDTGDEDTAADVDADGDGYTVASGDCDDTRDWVYPGAPDGCDGLDQDCDGEAIPPGACADATDAAAAASWVIEGEEEWVTGGAYSLPRGSFALLSASPDWQAGYAALDSMPAAPHSAVTALKTVYVPYPRETARTVGSTENPTPPAVESYVFTSHEDEYFPESNVYVVTGIVDDWPPGLTDVRDLAALRWTDDDPDDWLETTLSGGDLDGDGAGDILAAWALSPWDEHRPPQYTVLMPGRTSPGEYKLSAEPRSFVVSDAYVGWMGPDLDGDGSAELLGAPWPENPENALSLYPGGELATLSGDDAADYATNFQLATWRGRWAAVGGPWNTALDTRADLDGDGAPELPLYVWLDSASANGLKGLALASGLPSGDLTLNLEAVLLPAESGKASLEPKQWLPDLDGDDRPELTVLIGDAHADTRLCLVRGGDILGGGVTQVVDVDLPVGPCVAEARTATLADLDDDGLPEWLIGDPDYVKDDQTVGAVYILAGFDIPWEEAAKW